MDGLWWKTLLKWMIWGYHYFWKHPTIEVEKIGGKHLFFGGGGPGVLVLAWDSGFLLLLLSYYSFLNFQTFFAEIAQKKL